MLIKEFRIPLPLEVDEYKVGQLYSVAQASKNETGGGEGVEIRKNEPMDHPEYGQCQYTYKVYHLASKVPRFIRLIMPKGALEIHEEAWNAYPYCRTIITNPDYMKAGFQVKIETWHKQNDGQEENVHNLDDALLAKREVVFIDIRNDKVDAKDYKEAYDMSKYHSEKSNRGPFEQNWKETTKPIMTAYKLVTVEFKWFGLQGKVEKFIQGAERKLFANFHRQLVGTLDEWHDLSIEDIRRIEDETAKELEKMRDEGEVRGTTVDDP